MWLAGAWRSRTLRHVLYQMEPIATTSGTRSPILASLDVAQLQPPSLKANDKTETLTETTGWTSCTCGKGDANPSLALASFGTWPIRWLSLAGSQMVTGSICPAYFVATDCGTLAKLETWLGSFIMSIGSFHPWSLDPLLTQRFDMTIVTWYSDSLIAW